MGPWFKVSSEIPEKQGIDLAIPGLVALACYPLQYHCPFALYNSVLGVCWHRCRLWLDCTDPQIGFCPHYLQICKEHLCDMSQTGVN